VFVAMSGREAGVAAIAYQASAIVCSALAMPRAQPSTGAGSRQRSGPGNGAT
jgi:hypothetical protein